MYGSCPIPGEDNFNYSNQRSDARHINSTIWQGLILLLCDKEKFSLHLWKLVKDRIKVEKLSPFNDL